MKRIVLVDFLRGITVLLMIITHVIGLTLDHSNSTDKAVEYIGLIGGIASFTSFLFLSGISGYLSFIKNEETDKDSIRKIIQKELKIILVYYILSFAALVTLDKILINTTASALRNNVVDVLTFTVLPEFTEFLPALALFSLSLIFLKRFYQFLSDNLIFTTVIGLLLYFLGTFLLPLDLGTVRLNSLKALLTGHLTATERIHSFPLLQYWIIFLLGIFYGKFLYDNVEQKLRLKFAVRFLAVSSVITAVLVVAYEVTKISLFYPLPVEGRFPPSLGFLSLSLTITSALLIFSNYIVKYIPKYSARALIYLSKNALQFFFAHIILLFGIKAYIDSSNTQKPTDLVAILIIFAITVFFSWIIVWALDSAAYLITKSKKFRNSLNFVIFSFLPNVVLLASILILSFILYTYITASSEASKSLASELEKRIVVNAANLDWWDDSYQFKRNLNIVNTSNTDFYQYSWVSFIFDHAGDIQSSSNIQRSGADLRIIYFDSTNQAYLNLPFILENPNTSQTKLTFQLQSNIISTRESNDYYLYYGNLDADSFTKNESEIGNIITDAVTISERQTHIVQARVTKEWILKDQITSELKDRFTFEITLPENIGENTFAYYSVSGILRGQEMQKGSRTVFTAQPDLGTLEPGVYTIQAEIIDLDNNLRSYRTYKVPFRVTYPLYVTWSQDWEGWDVYQYNLDEMDNIANRYGIPVTQLFNPRIFAEDQSAFYEISDDRAAYLTQWVKDRKASRGDEIGMHLHLFADMVKEAGVTPRAGTVVGAMYGDGRTSDFTQDELEKIFRWGMQKFQEHGLPKPITYRTGGWMSGPHVLQAAQNAGFMIDTSGRTGGLINPALSYSTPVPWNLTETTRPYLPTVGDINRWEGERMSIWEFPNNGADSYWFSGDELIHRFQLNYGATGIQDAPQVLTYLTHPHWLTSIDAPKLHMLFQYISNYLYKNDDGPVVFSTIEGAYNEWNKSKFINGN